MFQKYRAKMDSIYELVKKGIARYKRFFSRKIFFLPCMESYASGVCSSIFHDAMDIFECTAIVRACYRELFNKMLRTKRLRYRRCGLILSRIDRKMERLNRKYAETGIERYREKAEKLLNLKQIISEINVLDLCQHGEGCFGTANIFAAFELWDTTYRRTLAVRVISPEKSEIPRFCLFPFQRAEDFRALQTSFILSCFHDVTQMQMDVTLAVHTPSDAILPSSVDVSFTQSFQISDTQFIDLFPVYYSVCGIGYASLDIAVFSEDAWEVEVESIYG